MSSDSASKSDGPATEVEPKPRRSGTTSRQRASSGRCRSQLRRPSDIALVMTLQSLPSLSPKEAAPERIRWLQAAIAADPTNSAAYTNLGRAFTDTDQTDKSLACFRKAVEVDPGNAVACNNLGAALNGKGRHAESIPWFRKAIALDPTDSLAHSNLGEALASQGHLDEGIACRRSS